MVEDGYLSQKNFERNEWMLKSTKDPNYQTEDDRIQSTSLTAPQALKNINIRKLNQVNKLTQFQNGETSKDTWNIKFGIESYLEIDNYIQ